MNETELLIFAESVDSLTELAIKISIAFWIEASFDEDYIASIQSDAERALAEVA